MVQTVGGHQITRIRSYQRAISRLLPNDDAFWSLYAPVIRILKDSNEHKKIRQIMNEKLGLVREDKVLDAGCGKGIWLGEISPKVTLAVGLDAEKKMIEAAKEIDPRVSFLLADLNQPLPLRDEAFNKIGSILVQGYLRNQQVVAHECFRILSPGGKMAVVTPKKGASFFKVLMAEVRQRRLEKASKEENASLGIAAALKDKGNLKRLVLGLTASLIFGKMAEIKAMVGDWHFYDKKELEDLYRAAGFYILGCELVYADQAWLLIASKPA